MYLQKGMGCGYKFKKIYDPIDQDNHILLIANFGILWKNPILILIQAILMRTMAMPMVKSWSFNQLIPHLL